MVRKGRKWEISVENTSHEDIDQTKYEYLDYGALINPVSKSEGHPETENGSGQL